MNISLPLPLFLKFKDLHGEKIAREYFEVYENTTTILLEEVRKDVVQKKLELRDELSKELASKSDIQLAESKIDLKLEKLNNKFNIYFIILLSTILFTNKDTLSFILQLFGVIK